MDVNLANNISEICLNFFDKLPKTGKPILNQEWTVLSCIVQYDNVTNKLDVVSLGVGTKCLNEKQLSKNGDIINDSHAEIMARRGFLRYIMEQIKNAKLKENNSIFTFNTNKMKFSLKSNINFHFFTSHSPCGDASIFDINVDNDLPPPLKKSKLIETSPGTIITKEQNFTGAKLMSNDKIDLMEQDIGFIRTKPGKGIRTLSVSCSDKLARWNILGVQGAILLQLLELPIYFESIIFCDGTICNVEATERALYKRFNHENINIDSKFIIKKPKILIATNSLKFKYAKSQNDLIKMQPCPTSIVWSKVTERVKIEVSVSGKKQGVTKKLLATPAGRLKITKIELFRNFLEILKLFPEIKEYLYPDNKNLDDLLYINVKQTSKIYYNTWNYLKINYFLLWTKKSDEFLKFTINN